MNGSSPAHQRLEDVPEERKVEGVVKWYDLSRGFGFIVADEEEGDILVHASSVRAFGAASLKDRDRVVAYIIDTPRGRQVARLIEITSETCEEPTPSPVLDERRPTDIAAAAARQGVFLPARVKWFDKHKGFGFVNVYGDRSDVFVHMETVRAGGFATLQPGEAVLVRTTKGPRGAMVSQVCEWASIDLTASPPDANVARLKTPDQDAEDD